jgi:hypothetical protein
MESLIHPLHDILPQNELGELVEACRTILLCAVFFVDWDAPADVTAVEHGLHQRWTECCTQQDIHVLQRRYDDERVWCEDTLHIVGCCLWQRSVVLSNQSTHPLSAGP